MKKCLALLLLLSLSAAQASEDMRKKMEEKRKELLEQKSKCESLKTTLGKESSEYTTCKLLYSSEKKKAVRSLLDTIHANPEKGASLALTLGAKPNTLMPKHYIPWGETDILGHTAWGTLEEAYYKKECPLAGLQLLIKNGGNPNKMANHPLHKEAKRQGKEPSFPPILTAQEFLNGEQQYRDNYSKKHHEVNSCMDKIQELFDKTKL
ncbi:MAG: hypothetical protein AB7R69_01660 [Candidatus Babeliales bacterium]